MLDDALLWAVRGLPVFALSPRSKVPAKGSRGSKDATRDEAAIREMWAGNPDGNIGVATGGGFFVVDLDGPEAASWFINSCVCHGLCEPTLEQRTARGLHLFFRCDSEVRNSASMIAPGADIRGEGGYVVAAPSIHPSGDRYRLVRDLPIAPAPRWLLEAAIPKREPPPPPHFGPPPAWRRTPDAAFARALAIIVRLLEARTGERNNMLFWAARRFKEMIQDGLVGRADAEAALIDAASRIGLHPVEARKTIASAIQGGARHG
jgi:Bifunctional DNA primase/polymerase, N-terminal